MFSYASNLVSGAASAAAPAVSTSSGACVPRKVSLEERKQMLALPITSALKQGASFGKRGKKKGNKRSKAELHTVCSNDTRPPWLKRPSTRDVVVSTTLTVVSQNFIVTSTTVPVFAGWFFQLAALPDYASYAACFDEYMFREIEVLIEPQQTETTSGAVGMYVTCVDVDDATAPTTAAELGGSESAVNSQATASHYHRFQPSAAVATYSGAFTSFANVVGLWCDCASPSIQHYGLKGASYGSTTSAQTLLIQWRAHVLFRSLH